MIPISCKHMVYCTGVFVHWTGLLDWPFLPLKIIIQTSSPVQWIETPLLYSSYVASYSHICLYCDRLPLHHWSDQGDLDHTRRGERGSCTHWREGAGHSEAGQLLCDNRRQPEVPHHAHHSQMWGEEDKRHPQFRRAPTMVTFSIDLYGICE